MRRELSGRGRGFHGWYSSELSRTICYEQYEELPNITKISKASSLFGPSRRRHMSPDDLCREGPVIHYLELKDARQNLRGAETGPEVQIPIDDRSRVEIAPNCVPLSSLSGLSIGS